MQVIHFIMNLSCKHAQSTCHTHVICVHYISHLTDTVHQPHNHFHSPVAVSVVPYVCDEVGGEEDEEEGGGERVASGAGETCTSATG